MLFGLMQRTKKGLHLEQKEQCFYKILLVSIVVILPNIILAHPSDPPLHLLHQLQQGLLELAADGRSLIFPGDSAALSHVTSSLLTCDLCVSQEEVRHHLDTEGQKKKKGSVFSVLLFLRYIGIVVSKTSHVCVSSPCSCSE